MPTPRLLLALAAAGALTVPSSALADGWSAGVPVSESGASAPSLAADGSGGVTAAWIRGGVVEAAVRGASGTFPSPQALSGTQASSASIASNAAGRAVVVWVRDGAVRAAIRPAAGQPFAVAQQVSSTGSVQTPRAGVDAAGNVTIGWIRGSVVEVVRRTAGQGAWPAPQQFNESNPSNLALAVAPDGGATVLWTSLPGGSWDLRALRRGPAAATFDAAETLEAAVDDVVGFPPAADVVADGTSAFTATWANHQVQQDTPRAPVIRSARRASGAAFGTRVTISAGGVNDEAADPRPRVAGSAGGDAVVVWNRMFDDVTSVVGARRAGSGAFDGQLPAGDPGADAQSAPAVALDAQAAGAAVWSQSGVIQGSRLTSTFAHPQTLSGSGAGAPSVVFDAAGNAVAAWARAGRIESAAYDVTPPQLGSATVPATAVAGEDVGFTASGSDGESAVRVDWAFGDGAGATGDAVTHRFTARGTYTVTPTAVDGGGNATAGEPKTIVVSPAPGTVKPGGGDGTSRPDDRGPAGPSGPTQDGPAPGGPSGDGGPASTPLTLTGLRVKPAKLRPGGRGKVTFTLSRAGRVTLNVERRAKGGTFRRLAGSIAVTGRAGANTVTFRAKLGGRSLRPGRYRLVATPDGGKAVTASLRVVRR